jgi:orotidine-5'-phosphate decarboxylase
VRATKTAFENPLCVALDSTDRDDLSRLVESVAPHAGLVKIGLAAFASFGPQVIGDISRSVPVFVDLKLHDIPMQVGQAAGALARAGAALLTVHAAGGPEMIAAAVAGAADVPVVAVTILTSLGDRDLAAIGLDGSAIDNVTRLGTLAVDAGAAGVVCSPLEIAALRATFGDEPMIVTPGIRGTGEDRTDQARTMDARAAVEAGADIIVVGRPITSAEDPGAAAATIAEAIG